MYLSGSPIYKKKEEGGGEFFPFPRSLCGSNEVARPVSKPPRGHINFMSDAHDQIAGRER